MPTYDFRCAKCKHKFTIMVGISEKDKVKCPACGSNKVNQLFTGCQVRTSGNSGCNISAFGGNYGGG